MNERFREVRKCLNLSLDKFGERIGISSASCSRIETGINNPSKQTILTVCNEFGVNEEWLRTGEGEMFRRKTVKEELMEFVGDIIDEDDDTRMRFILALSKIPPEHWKFIADFWQNYGE